MLTTNYLIDSHCHLHDKSCFPDETGENSPAAILEQSAKNNVRQLIVVGTTHADSLAAANFAATHDNVFYAHGIHPSEAGKDNACALRTPLREEGDPMEGSRAMPAAKRGHRAGKPSGQDPRSVADNDTKLVAIGEVGLDYHYQPYDRTAQINLLEQMIALAKAKDLPLIFHVREAFDDFFPIVDNQHVQHAVIHSFSDNQKNLEKALSRGYYIGVNGLATFANIPLPPLDRTLLETDAPYLTPVPFRGKINKSSYIKNIAEYLSDKLEIPFAEIERSTTQNVQTLFHLPIPVFRAE